MSIPVTFIDEYIHPPLVKWQYSLNCQSQISGLPRCKNLWTFSLFCAFCFSRFYCLYFFVFFVLRHLWVNSPGERGTPLYKPDRYVPPHQVGFLRRFGLKTGKHFAHFGRESGMFFVGYGVYERVYRFNFKWAGKKEKYANSKCIWIIFCLRSNS